MRLRVVETMRTRRNGVNKLKESDQIDSNQSQNVERLEAKEESQR